MSVLDKAPGVHPRPGWFLSANARGLPSAFPQVNDIRLRLTTPVLPYLQSSSVLLIVKMLSSREDFLCFSFVSFISLVLFFSATSMIFFRFSPRLSVSAVKLVLGFSPCFSQCLRVSVVGVDFSLVAALPRCATRFTPIRVVVKFNIHLNSTGGTKRKQQPGVSRYDRSFPLLPARSLRRV